MKKIIICLISLVSISSFAENLCPKANPAIALPTYTAPCIASGEANGFSNFNQTHINLNFENLSNSIEKIKLSYYTQCSNNSDKLPTPVTEHINLAIGQKISKTISTNCNYANVKKYWTEAYPVNLYSGIYFVSNADNLKFKVTKN